jgi:hypothetical protein
LRVFFDRWHVTPGSNLPFRLTEAIDQSRRIAFVLSPASVSSDWVGMEVDTAIARRDPSGRRGVLVPILRADCDIPIELSHLSYIDFRRGRYRQGLTQLVDLLRDRTADRGPGSANDVRRLAEDCDLISAHRSVFLRPAFSQPLVLELSLSELATAVDDTVAALNTGAQYSRSGRLLARTETRGNYQTDQFRSTVETVMQELGELQRVIRDLANWTEASFSSHSSRDDGDWILQAAYASGPSLAREALRRMDSIDNIRNSILDEINELLRVAGVPSLDRITLSSDLSRKLPRFTGLQSYNE